MRLSTNIFENVEPKPKPMTSRATWRYVVCLVSVVALLALTQVFAGDPAESAERPNNRLAPASATALAQGKAKPEAVGHHAEHDEMLQACAKACSDCQRACDTCATHCAHLMAEGKKEHLTSLMTCRDCATICAAAAQIVAGGGPFSAIICDSCAAACVDCAKMCATYPDDKHMQVCADECRKCEKACRAMLKHLGSK